MNYLEIVEMENRANAARISLAKRVKESLKEGDRVVAWMDGEKIEGFARFIGHKNCGVVTDEHFQGWEHTFPLGMSFQVRLEQVVQINGEAV